MIIDFCCKNADKLHHHGLLLQALYGMALYGEQGNGPMSGEGLSFFSQHVANESVAYNAES